MAHKTLPQPISAANSPFAAFTFEKRFPHIISQIHANNALSPGQEGELGRLLDEIREGVASPGQADFDEKDWPFWETFARQRQGKSYAEIPFYEAEAYIYYRTSRIMGYPQHGSDPFATLKTAGLMENQGVIEKFAKTHQAERERFHGAYFTALLYNSLWANSADLSQLDANDVLLDDALRGRLVIDDTQALQALIDSPSTTQVDFIADNAGIELVSDLFLIDYLLHTGRIKQVNLHVKQYPIFVSDATAGDVSEHLALLRRFPSREASLFAEALQAHIAKGRLNVRSHRFWNSPCHFTALPADLKNGFDAGTLLLFKGDANYRRLFEDREWPFATPASDVLGYLERPCASIRTLKSEIVLGVQPEKAAQLANEDKDWLTNGRYGLVMVER